MNDENLPTRNLQEAKEALERKRHDRREQTLPALGRKPHFAPYCDTYLAKATVLRKRPGTVENEQQALGRWRAHLGHVRIDRITTPMISAFIDKRLKRRIVWRPKVGRCFGENGQPGFDGASQRSEGSDR
jgi:hypothetical protein